MFWVIYKITLCHGLSILITFRTDSEASLKVQTCMALQTYRCSYLFYLDLSSVQKPELSRGKMISLCDLCYTGRGVDFALELLVIGECANNSRQCRLVEFCDLTIIVVCCLSLLDFQPVVLFV